jgi:purine-binding chemotaxis protein CheW
MARKKRVAVQARTLTTVTFVLGREECAVPITDVHQVIRDVPVRRMPNVNVHVEGVLNLRGVVVPILDLKHRLGLGIRTLGPRHRILILDLGGRLIGFSVDAVTGVFEFEESALQAPPDIVLARMEAAFIRGVVPRGDSVAVLLDTNEVLNVHSSHQAAPAHAAVARSREY